MVSKHRSSPDRKVEVLAGAILAPFAATSGGTLFLPESRLHALAALSLALCALGLIAAMGFLHLGSIVRRGAVRATDWMMVCAPSGVAIVGCGLIPIVGFRWAYALFLGALAGQGWSDFRDTSTPPILMRLRPVLSVGAMLTLLVGFIGC